VNLDVGEEGGIQLIGFHTEMLTKAEEFFKALIAERSGRGGGGGGDDRKYRPKYEGPDAIEGETYTGKITGIHQFGVFVEILPGAGMGRHLALKVSFMYPSSLENASKLRRVHEEYGR
jgi:polyribonucleotide nucleotidyltransferase